MAEPNTNAANDDNNNNNNDNELATESTPLLAPAGEPTSGTDIEPTDATEPTSPTLPIPRPIRILTFLSLFGSSITLLSCTGAFITSQLTPVNGYAFWMVQEAVANLGLTAFLTLLLSAMNTRVRRVSGVREAVPIPVNAIFDALIVLFAWNLAGRLAESLRLYECYCPVELDCERWTLVLKVLGWIAVGGGAVVGLAHLILFVMRCVAIFRSRFWTSPMPWTFPTGQLTFEFTVKVLRQERQGEV